MSLAWAEAVEASPCKKVMTESRVSVDVEETTDSEYEKALATVVMAEETWTIQAVGSISTATMMEQCGEILQL